MNLPNTRNTNYAPAQPVLSNDLNAIQDCIIGKKHGSVERWFPPQPGSGYLSTNIAPLQPYKVKANADAAFLAGIPCPMEVGDLVIGVIMAAKGIGGGGANALSVSFNLSDGAGGHTAIATFAVTAIDPPAAYAYYSQNLAAPHAIVRGEWVTADIAMAKANMEIGGFAIVYSRP